MDFFNRRALAELRETNRTQAKYAESLERRIDDLTSELQATADKLAEALKPSAAPAKDNPSGLSRQRPKSFRQIRWEKERKGYAPAIEARRQQREMQEMAQQLTK